MMTTKSVGLYLHTPFCVRKCNYCDFCSFPEEGVSSLQRAEYIDTLVAEITGYKREPKIAVDTVFFGGGTPSLLAPSEIERIFTAIGETFEIAPDAEITIEANPKTLSREKLELYRNLGINRLSIGLQSIHENEQKSLGRVHNYTDFIDNFKLARASGFDNISVDLMYGIPEQTTSSFSETLDAVIALQPEHISAYGLIIEEGTPFFKMRESLPIPTEDAECDMYRLAVEKLSAAGYSHYEISNYARAGRESRHNLHYWRLDEYIGVGIAAHSFFEGRRYSNPESLAEYTKDSRMYTESADDREFEYAMLAFRLAEGLSLTDFEKRFSHSFTDGREELISRYTSLGYMRLCDGRLALTDDGMYVSNAILSELL